MNCVAFLLLHLAVGVFAGNIRRLASVNEVTKDAPIYPVRVESLGAADPLLANLDIPENAVETGAWSSLQTWPLVAIHAAVLPDGKLVTYGGRPNAAIQDGRTYTFWDPKLGFSPESLNTVRNADRVDSFCSSGVLLSDGTFLVAGGKGFTSARSVESSQLDYRTQVATRAGNMFAPHWYGTMTKLPDGRALMTGGGVAYAIGRYNPDYVRDKISPTPEVFTEGDGWSTLSGATSRAAFGADANRYWYPHQWITARGTVFGISADKMWEMNVQGRGSVTILGDFKVPPGSESTARPNVGATSSAVMYDTGKIIQMGGNGFANGYPSYSSAEASLVDITDISNGIVHVTETAPMAIPRQWHNAMVLPDGKVLVTGGTKYALTDGENAVYDAEIWDPATGEWTLAAKAAVFRAYHSVALVLPNGAVYSGGSGIPGPVQNFNAEVYFPPYYFKKLNNGTTVLRNRPTIVSMSSNSLNYGDLLQVQMAPTTSIKEVSLIALPVVTHSFDSNQRRMTLTFELNAQGHISVVMPATPNLAPPGHYYLNLVNMNGIPSESAIISLSAAAPPVLGRPVLFEPITGAFIVEVNACFNVLSGRSWQRIIDFSNGIQSDNIILGQIRDTAGIFLSVYRGDVGIALLVQDVIVAGEMATWKAGVGETGWMWIEKNGVRVGERQGHLPRNVFRAMQNVGSSSWPRDSTLHGQVSGLKFTNKRGYNDGGKLNMPKQITGAFSASAIVVFHDINGGRKWQRVFDFGNGPGLDNIVLSQHANWRNMMLEVWRDGVSYRLVAERAIVQGELATWRAGVDTTGLMWIEKNGQRIASMAGVVPRNILRRNMLLGESNWSGDDQLVGAVLGLEVVNEAETGVPEQVTGAFVSEVSARFDNLSRSWQRIFDFGNGPEQDNIVLSQYGRSDSMALEIWRDGKNHQMVAPKAIVQGELATWKVGVDVTGWMWLEKNGVRLIEQQGVVPRNVYRANTLFGESNWVNNDDHAGVILGHDVANADGDAIKGGLLNFPNQIDGEFSVQVTARLDNLSRSWQRIFDFGSKVEVSKGIAFGNIAFGQSGNTDDALLEIWSLSGDAYRLLASHAIMQGEVALWQVGVDRTGLMWIAKNGNRLAEGPGIIPPSIFRQNLLIGESNWDHSKLDGVILGLRVSTYGQGGFLSSVN